MTHGGAGIGRVRYGGRLWPALAVVLISAFCAPAYAQMYKEVGELTEHGTHVLFLDPEYGFSMMYHAEVSGDSWPNVDDLAAEAIDGRPPIDADARFERDYAYADPTYFVITDLSSLAAEKDLQAMLEKRTTPVRLTNRYRIYKFTAAP